MNGAQKTIKALAIAFAAMVIVGVVSMVFGVGVMLDRIFWSGSRAAQDLDWQETVISEQVTDMTELYIELESASLKIEQGEEFQVLADADVVEFRRSGQTVYVEEKDLDFFSHWREIGGEVKIILPKDVKFTKVTIDMGAGAMMVEDVVAEELKLDLGAGRAELARVEATRVAKIEGGAGLLVVREVELNNLDLDMGVGKVEVTAKLTGENKVSAGLGKLELTLIGEQDDYQVTFEQGLGAMNLQDIVLNNSNGKHRVEIDGGVGAIDLSLRNI